MIGFPRLFQRATCTALEISSRQNKRYLDSPSRVDSREAPEPVLPPDCLVELRLLSYPKSFHHRSHPGLRCSGEWEQMLRTRSSVVFCLKVGCSVSAKPHL